MSITIKPQVLQENAAARQKAAGLLSANKSHWAVLAAAIIAILAFWLRVHNGPLLLDDAYISMRYARNFVAGHGFVYNIGERVMAASCPLWLLILAGAARLHISLPAFSCYFSATCDAVTVFLLIWIGRQVVHPVAGIIIGLTYALTNTSVALASGGMETPLFILLFVSCAAFLQAGKSGPATVCASLLAVTRPEGILFTAAYLAVLCLQRRKIPIRHVIASLLPLTAWILFSLIYYGHVLPNSVAAKAATFPVLPDRMHNALQMLAYISEPENWYPADGRMDTTQYALLLVMGIGAAWLLRRSHATAILVASTALFFLAYAITNRYMFGWYLNPLLPGSYFALVTGGFVITRNIVNLCNVPQKMRGYGCLAAGCVVTVSIIYWLLPNALSQPILTRRDIAAREDVYAQAGRWVESELKDHPVIAIHEIGAFGAYYHGKIFDLCALASPEMIPYWKPVQGKELEAKRYLSERHPRYFIQWRSTGSTGEYYPGFLKDYRMVKLWVSAEKQAHPRELVLYEFADARSAKSPTGS